MSNGRFPQEVIDTVLKAHDIVEVVGRHVHLTKQGHYLKGLCPFHSEKSPSFTVTPEKQIYHCFGCGAGGNAIRFISEVEGLSFGQAVRKLAEEAHLQLGPDSPGGGGSEPRENPERRKLIEAHELAAKLYQYILHNTEQGRPAKEYLHSRGISDKLMETFGIGFIPNSWDTLTKLLDRKGFPLDLMERGGLLTEREGGGYYDKFRDRVIFPIQDWKGQVIAFGGRAMGDVQPKYLNSPESLLFHKSRTLYNLHAARPQVRKQQELVLFEGYMDVIRAWDAGVHNGVATMGTALTAEHAEAIRRLADRVIIAYDGDHAGQSAAFKSIPLLEKAGCEVKVAMLPGGLDPDEYIRDNGSERFVREVLGTAVPSFKYKLLYPRRNFKLQEDAGRLKYITESLKLIAELPSPIEREHYVKDLISEFHYSYDTAMQTVNEHRMKAEKKRDSGDNKDVPWNNGMNEGRPRAQVPSMVPAYQYAERQLLAVMMQDREIAAYVERELGDGFNMEAHAALAAYLYAYYAEGAEPNVSTFIGMLQDDKLESLASSLSLGDNRSGINDTVIDDYIRQIRRFPLLQALERKREEVKVAERSGDITKALQLGSEIISLEKQLKSS
ncbi:DNA primase [Paenibacillus mucilaginosus]|uniref:DNA primase n=1 Tax=Paenibacillus mucilaginosus (strain KNP414) TaxID=1036673 RepID=F8FDS8_PAEMK|nr:DNA primase [Paenibacillus mucilaginosus]AEI42643.1 DNA primase [Paenibacillus mucilaginosus KNP414]MCG7214033.1 DNA primase [Paenibacillus mucilaginosus]WDM26033.1 DNA primase [Paenibacillus mucilaginosus]